MKKRLFSLGLCLLLCISLLPVSASAEDIEMTGTIRYDLNGGYILVRKDNGDIMYASPEISGDVVIPEEVEGITITRIYAVDGGWDNFYGFNNCHNITSLTLPGTIKKVFADSLPYNDDADCTVIFQEGFEELYEHILYSGHAWATKYVLPKTLKVMQGRCSSNPKLTIELDPANPYFTVDEQGLMITKDGKTLVTATRSGEEMKSYTIPYGVEELGYRSLYRCSALTDVYLPDSIQKVTTEFPAGVRLHARSGGAVEKYVTDYNKDVGENRVEFVSTGEKLPYTDIGTGWSVPYIGWAYDTGAMTGTGDTTFSPSNPVTRGMAVTTLHRLSKESSDFEHPFTDVSEGAYYSEAVSWAAENEVVNGINDTTFAPGRNITREQLAVMLYRYAEYLEMDTSKRADISKYTDAGSISGYARTAMQWANAEGILNGRTETTLSPKGVTTRAEYAAVLQRLVGEK